MTLTDRVRTARLQAYREYVNQLLRFSQRYAQEQQLPIELIPIALRHAAAESDAFTFMTNDELAVPEEDETR